MPKYTTRQSETGNGWYVLREDGTILCATATESDAVHIRQALNCQAILQAGIGRFVGESEPNE